ncbi:hypothetical protein [Gottfriedia solisilvae]|uniref:Uncharacterized protein n=1 Tax=Gottfriedia solisilvae TaxID=1516104 RepID=A0A8J3EWP1_9BACI|nr:hypothetical protein [Gottfriedia solisilvae]GGI11655.1 hypothetical protein GCM10007380_08930 [Gottfriedia solisilvae]
MNSKNLIIASVILSLGIIIGCLLLSLKFSSSIKVPNNKIVVENKVLMDINEASKFLGLSVDEIKEIINAEQESLDKYGGFNGIRLPFIVINRSYFFERTSLMIWVKDSFDNHRIYNDGKMN